MSKRKRLVFGGLVIIILSIVSMGLLDFFKSKPTNDQFVSETAFANNRNKQSDRTPQTLEQLRKIDVTEEKELALEYFFYTNSEAKAKELAAELDRLNYKVNFGVSAGDKKLFVITGWTTKMKMADEVVKSWTIKMCDLGYQFDCEFDGWGTSPDQD
jgi:hypothetical protein